VCPVDCIYGLTVDDPNFRKQLFIDPEECIDCAACEPECPWNAIFQDAEVPDIFKEDIEINAQIFKTHPKEDFTTTPTPIRENPKQEQIAENFKKWDYHK